MRSPKLQCPPLHMLSGLGPAGRPAAGAVQGAAEDHRAGAGGGPAGGWRPGAPAAGALFVPTGAGEALSYGAFTDSPALFGVRVDGGRLVLDANDEGAEGAARATVTAAGTPTGSPPRGRSPSPWSGFPPAPHATGAWSGCAACFCRVLKWAAPAPVRTGQVRKIACRTGRQATPVRSGAPHLVAEVVQNVPTFLQRSAEDG